MKTALLVVLESQGQHYIALGHNDKENAYYIQAYETKADVIKAFDGFVRFGTGTYEQSSSSCIGLIQINPIAVRLEESELVKYVTDQKAYTLQSMAVSPIKAVKCSDDILKHKEFDIMKEISKEISNRLKK